MCSGAILVSEAVRGTEAEPDFFIRAICDDNPGCGWSMQHPDPEAIARDWWIHSDDWAAFTASHEAHRQANGQAA